jgi:hypothetical protein
MDPKMRGVLAALIIIILLFGMAFAQHFLR